jgi:signal transduction histidine kinase
MQRARLLRSTPFRLALTYGLIFVISSLAVSAITFSLLRAELYSALDADMQNTFSVIESSYAPGDIEDLIATIKTFSRLQHGDERVFYLGTPNGHQLAGNLSSFVPTRGLTTVTANDLGFSGDGYFRIMTGKIGGNDLLVGQSLEATEDLEQILLANFGWITVLTVIIAFSTGMFLARRAHARIDAITETMEAVSNGDLKGRIPLSGGDDDIDVVSAQINGALDRLSNLLDGMRQVSADIAHDLKTPLNRLRLSLEEAAIGNEGGRAVGKQIEEALEESQKINATFEALLRISQIEAGARKSRFALLNLHAVLANVAEIYADVAEDNGHILSYEPAGPAGCMLQGDKELLTQMFVNLVENAINHCPPGTEIKLSLSRSRDGCIAAVADNGEGVPAEDRENVFRRLYRLDKSRKTKGSGLGLSMVKAIAELHGMTIAIKDNKPGTRVELTLPKV